MNTQSELQLGHGRNEVRPAWFQSLHQAMEQLRSWPPGNQTLVWAFVALGVLTRLRQYVLDRSLWLDESFLALNILHRSPVELLKPLDYDQAAPLGFLLLEKSAVMLLGTSELVLRLIPFLCGVASVFLFAEVARRYLAPLAVPIAVGLFAISDPLIYYSSEAKQYSGDVAATLLLYLLLRPLIDQSQVDLARRVTCAFAGAASVWFSQATVFTLAALGLVALWRAYREKDAGRFAWLTAICATWASSLLVYYLVSLRAIHQNQNLLRYWYEAFAPLPPSLYADTSWALTSLANLVTYPFVSRHAQLGLESGIATAAVLGALELNAMQKRRSLVLVLPSALTLAAAAFQLYPFSGRLLLFLVPSIVLLVASGFALVVNATGNTRPVIGILLIGFVCIAPLLTAGRNLIKGEFVEELKPAIKYVVARRVEGDSIYVYYASVSAFEYYKERGLIGAKNVIIGTGSWAGEWNSDNYKTDLDRLRGKKRVWLLFSHVYSRGRVNDGQFYFRYLNSFGKCLDHLQATDASAYLYDFSTPSK